MRHQIPLRITVREPLKGVFLKVQRGRNELIDASSGSGHDTAFDIVIDVDLGSSTPNFLGPFAQGPKDVRFLYVNSGSFAGQFGTCWSRRAKIGLMSITKEQIEAVIADATKCLSVEFDGVGRDGGPTCGSVKNVVWVVSKK